MSGYSMGSSCISMPSYDGATTRRSYSAAKPETPGYSVAKPITRVEVGAYDNYFEPRTLTVNVGTTIRFQNHGHHAHTVTAKNHAFDSGDISPGADFLVRFKSAGTYHFYCRHHTKDKMEGTIIVESSASGSGDPNRSDSSRY